MNRWLTLGIAAAFATAALPALAQHDHANMHGPAPVHAAAPASLTDGVVKRVDKPSGRITIAHEAIRNLDMPKMTMAFKVKDTTWLERVKEGDRVRFVAENPNGVLTLIALDTVK